VRGLQPDADPIPSPLLRAKLRAPNHLATWPCSYFSV